MMDDVSPGNASLARMSEEELFWAYREGNEMAMEMLLGRIGRPLFRSILRQVGDRSIAEDIFQDTLERIVRHRRKFDAKRSFRGWVWSIAIRRCIDHFRRHKREVPLENPDYGRSRQADPEQTAIGREKLARFARALEGLADQQREVFLLREEAGLSFATISDTTGRPLGTVLSQMHAALKKLHKALEE